MTDTTAPRTAAGRYVLSRHLGGGDPGGQDARAIRGIEDEAAEQAIDGAALTLGLTIDGAKMSKNYIETALARVKETYEREAIEPLLALVRAAQEIKDEQGKVCSDFEVCVHASCRSSYTSWAIAEAALAALPESVRVAARKPE